MTHILLQIKFKPEDEGGRAQLPLRGPWCPHLVVASQGELLGVRIFDIPADARPGVPVEVLAELLYEGVSYDILAEGAEVEVQEGPKVVATGIVIAGAG